jgi:hypothetical protein
MATLTWETATDWDNAQSEDGVVHESVANADHDDATIVKKGYPHQNPVVTSNLSGLYPLNEDSGTTAYDFSGKGNDGTYVNGILNKPGILGTTAFDARGDSNAQMDTPITHGQNFTYHCWWYIDSNYDTNGTLISNRDYPNYPNFSILNVRIINNDLAVRGYLYEDSGSNQYFTEYTDNTLYDQWNSSTLTYDGSIQVLYVNGTQRDSNSHNISGVGNNTVSVTARESGDAPFDGKAAYARIHAGTAISSSEVQTLYDIVATNGTLTTAKKTS